MEKLKVQIENYENLLSNPAVSQETKKVIQAKLDALRTSEPVTPSEEEVVVDDKKAFIDSIFIGFDKPSSYTPTAWSKAKKAMEQAIDLGWAEAYDFGKGKGKYTSTKEANETGLSISQIAEQVFEGVSVKEYKSKHSVPAKKPKTSKIKPKFKVGDKVNYIPSLSGFDPSTVLEINHFVFKETDELADSIGVESTPAYYYSFKDSNLNAVESDLKLAKSKLKRINQEESDHLFGKIKMYPKDQIELLASSATAQGIGKAITEYYMGSEITLDPISQFEWDVKNKKGVIDGVRVILRGDRYRFERVPERKPRHKYKKNDEVTIQLGGRIWNNVVIEQFVGDKYMVDIMGLKTVSESDILGLTKDLKDKKEEPVDFLKTITSPEREELKATLLFKNREDAEEFATAYARHTKRGHVIGAGTKDVTVSVDGLSIEDTRWIDNYSEKLNQKVKLDVSKLIPSDVTYKDGKYFVDNQEISAIQFKEIQDRAIKASKGSKSAKEKIAELKKQAMASKKATRNEKTISKPKERSREEFVKMYLDYTNNFVTVKAFADHYGMSQSEANQVIKKGRLYNEVDVVKMAIEKRKSRTKKAETKKAPTKADMIRAFGKDFMDSKDKGALKEYPARQSSPKKPLVKKSANDKIQALKNNPKMKGMLDGLTDEEIDRDLKRKAKPMGKRKSKDGNTYYEYRRTKSDVNPRKKI